VLNRVSFFLVAIFFVTMNVLLWRSEYAAHDSSGSAVPVAMVWTKILNAPDNSELQILRGGKPAGFCRWATEVTEASVTKTAADAALPEDLVRQPTGFRISVSGNVALTELTNRLGFDGSFTLATNQEWRALGLRLVRHEGRRRESVTVESEAASQSVKLKFDGQEGLEQEFKFSDLQNPAALLQEFQIPLPFPTGWLPAGNAKTAPRLGLEWTARTAWLNFGHTSARVYRLSARLLDRYEIVVIVSRAGEILRAEFPGELVLVNDRLGSG
jgi:hypothetical protein